MIGYTVIIQTKGFLGFKKRQVHRVIGHRVVSNIRDSDVMFPIRPWLELTLLDGSVMTVPAIDGKSFFVDSKGVHNGISAKPSLDARGGGSARPSPDDLASAMDAI